MPLPHSPLCPTDRKLSEKNTHVLLPEVIVEDMVLLHSTIRFVIMPGNAHQQFLSRTYLASVQTIVQQIIRHENAVCDSCRTEIGNEQFAVGKSCAHNRVRISDSFAEYV